MLQINSQENNNCYLSQLGDDGCQDDCGCDDNAGNDDHDHDCGCDKKKNYCSINPCDKAVDLLHGVDKNV
jgi:hypothetical protein